jgi:nondiscriminating glutamyl-tRNA synthetase
LHSLSQNNKEQKKELFSAIRKKLTGKNKGPELFKIIYLLGKEKVLRRLSKLLVNT